MDANSSKILIVDDDKAGRLALITILEADNYELLEAENGFQAIEKANETHPDIILMDVMMPGMDGFETCRRIRSQKEIAEIPILFLTALDDRQSLIKGLEAGADDFLTKPPDRLELRTRLMTITRLNRYRKLLEERSNLEDAHKKLLDAYDKTIEGWSRAMDLRDKETEGHTRRVTELTAELARRFGIEGDTLMHIRRGALLHDMGKLGIPDSVLLKADKLNDAEWDLMKQHPQMAYDMLNQIEYLRPALEIPLYHHEKWDGSGYPHGLKGEEIPLAARIFAVVDVWDALTSDRPYRASWSREKTLNHILGQAGTHFDPQVVEVFRQVVETGMISKITHQE